MKISGGSKFLGVLGNPIAHSLSPAIHNFTASSLGLDEWYLPLHYQGHDLAKLLDCFWQLNCTGINVTVPFKEAVAQLFPQSELKSANTLYRTSSGWQIDSTDGPGFIEAVSLVFDPSRVQNLVILGNGGSSLAIAKAWRQAFKQVPISIIRRNDHKDKLFAAEIGDLNFLAFNRKALADQLHKLSATLLVQCTSAPLHGNDLSDLVPCLDDLDGALIDITYGHPSALLTRAKQLAIPHQNGLAMLVGQARLSQLRWWGQTLDFAQILSHLHSLRPDLA